MTNNLGQVNQMITNFTERINKPKRMKSHRKLKVGVDLGTANIVLSVLTEENEPIAGAISQASVVRDGLVIDYVGAVDIVKKLKAKVENQLGVTLTTAAGAVPPGTIGGNKKVIQNVLESAMLDVTNIIDEPTAASSVLNIKEGAVVDVGGGTTGISILKNGEVIYTADEPTGGMHMTLALAGYLGVSFEEAEKIKKDKTREDEVFAIIQPVVEKMASISKRHVEDFHIDTIYVVGGSSSFTRFTQVLETHTGIVSLRPEQPLFLTPLGIAMHSLEDSR